MASFSLALGCLIDLTLIHAHRHINRALRAKAKLPVINSFHSGRNPLDDNYVLKIRHQAPIIHDNFQIRLVDFVLKKKIAPSRRY